MTSLRDIYIDRMSSRERTVKSALIFLFVPIIIVLCVGLGTWLGLKCNGILPCALTGIIISQVLLVVGIREIILFGHKKEA